MDAGQKLRGDGDRPLVGDGGYVVALTGLLILPLIAAVGLAVDLGAWYARAAQMQKAADAAALAGAAYLPDEGLAAIRAQAVAAQNGFDDADADITVTVTPVGSQQLQVSIDDNDVNQYFTSLFVSNVDVARSAVAEYVLPVAMGSPRNYLGTGNDPSGALTAAQEENFWLAASGPCASHENGDYLLPISDANYYFNPAPTNQNPGPTSGSTPWNRCRGSDAEGTTIDLTDGSEGDTYDPNGYFYAVEVPVDLSSVTIQGYDLSHCYDDNNDGSPSTNGEDSGGSFQTRYRVRGPDTNPYLPTDNPLISTLTLTSRTDTSGSCANSGSGYRNRWMTIQTISPAPAGIYFVQVDTLDDLANTASGYNTQRDGSNQFSLRARTGSSFSPCSTDQYDTAIPAASRPPAKTDCVGVYAIEWMGVYANLGGTYPSFFLADIGPEHSNKTMLVRLWDPGEGAQAIELLDPNGHSVDFEWSVVNGSGSDVAPTGGWSGTVDQAGSGACTSAPPGCVELDVLGNDPLNTGRGWNPQPGPFRGSRSKFSDRLLELRVDLPENIATAYGGKTWWRVRYTLGSTSVNITDRTTWSVTVSGDPVRLVG